MNLSKVLAVAVFTVAALSSAHAQAAAPGPKVAIIYTAAFSDEKAGIVPMAKAISGVNDSFKLKRDELNSLAAQIEQLRKEIENDTRIGTVSPAKLAEKTERGDELQRKFKRIQEDAQAAYDRALRASLEPINKGILRELEGFAKRRSIDIIIDASKEIGSTLLYVTGAADITNAFIAEYNAKQSGAPVP